jgi:hypothetical protein
MRSGGCTRSAGLLTLAAGGWNAMLCSVSTRTSYPLVDGVQSETADAARGAATKGGAWPGSGTLSCQSKVIVDEAVSAKSFLASHSTALTCS